MNPDVLVLILIKGSLRSGMEVMPLFLQMRQRTLRVLTVSFVEGDSAVQQSIGATSVLDERYIVLEVKTDPHTSLLVLLELI